MSWGWLFFPRFIFNVTLPPQSLLDEPNPNSPANSQAAQLYQENKREYEKRVSAIVEQSWRDSWPDNPGGCYIKLCVLEVLVDSLVTPHFLFYFILSFYALYLNLPLFFCNHFFFLISPSSNPSGGNVLKPALVVCQNRWGLHPPSNKYLLITIHGLNVHKGASIKLWVISVDLFLVLKEAGVTSGLGISHLSAVSAVLRPVTTCMIKCSPDPFTSVCSRRLQVKLCTDFALVVPM